MSIMINLLPDLRQAKQRAKSRRQLATGISIAVWSVCGAAIVILSLSVASQKLIKDNLTKTIADNTTKLNNVPNIVDALTAQAHLDSLGKLYADRVYLTKFLAAYSEADPADIVVNSLVYDTDKTVTISGTGKTFAAIAKLQRALESSHVTLGTGAKDSNTPYFSDVSVSSVSRTGALVGFTLKATASSEVSNGQ